MRRLRVRLSGAGVVAVLVLAAFVVAALAGSGAVQIIGFVGAVVVALALVGGVPLWGAGASGGHGLTSTARGRTIAYAEPEVMDEAPVDETAWRRERERREGAATARAGRGDAADESYDPFGSGRRR